MENPKVTEEGKRKALAEILLGKEVSGTTLRQIASAIEQDRGDLLLQIMEDFFRLAAESRQKITAEVTTAVPISEETRNRLEKTFSDLVGEAVFLKTLVDPSLLGGLLVRVGERIIDGSIRGQLLRMREGMSREILTEKGRSVEDKSR